MQIMHIRPLASQHSHMLYNSNLDEKNLMGLADGLLFNQFCCTVLRVANVRSLIIDHLRLCYLQHIPSITKQLDFDNCTVFLLESQLWLQFLYTFVLEGSKLPLGSWISKEFSVFLLNSGITLTPPWTRGSESESQRMWCFESALSH